MPKIGDRVHVCPAPGLQVQRGAGLYGQFLAPDGQEVTWDEFHEARQAAGELFLSKPKQAPPVDPSEVQ